MPARAVIELNSTIRLDCDLCKVFYEGPATSHIILTPKQDPIFSMGIEKILSRLGWSIKENPQETRELGEPLYILICPQCFAKALKDLETSNVIEH